MLKNTRLASFVAALFVAIALHQAGYLESIQNAVDERRMAATPRPASSGLVFIAIDKKSLDEVGVWPWPRSAYAKAVKRLLADEAGDIIFDIDFSTPSIPEEDQRFAEVLEEAGGSVVLPIFLQAGAVGGTGNALVESRPIPLLSDQAWLAGVNVVPDSDGVVRRYMNGLRIGDEIVPSVASMLSRREDLDTSSFRVDFSILPQTIASYSFADLVTGNIPAQAIAGKSVLIGAHALELRDTLIVPVHGAVPGPIVQMLAAETQLQGRTIKQLSQNAVYLMLLLSALLTTIFMPARRLRFQFAYLFGAAIFLEIAGLVFFSQWAVTLETVPFHILILVSAIAHIAADTRIKAWLIQLAKQDWRNTKDILDRVFSDSSDAILVIDEFDNVIEINAKFRNLFALQTGTKLSIGSGSELPAELVAEARRAFASLRSGDVGDAERHTVSLGHDRQERHIEFTITPSRMETMGKDKLGVTGSRDLVCVIARDVTIEWQQRKKLEKLSKFDPTTGAERRNLLFDRLQETIDADEAAGRSTTLVGVGLRRLKALNGVFGRAVGDELLQCVAARLLHTDRRIDGVARLDGDLFAIRLVAGPEDAQVVDICDRIDRELSVPFHLARQNVRATIYMGVAVSTKDRPRDAKHLVDDLEFALELAKASGDKRADYDPHLDKKHHRGRLVETVFDDAIENDQFTIVYQPQVQAADGRPVGAEALMRWEHPELGVISPMEFIEIAEATGRMEALGRFALNRACIDATGWPDEAHVSVNVSPVQFAGGTVVKDVREALRLSGLSPHRLDLEITESCFMASTEDLIDDLQELKNLGVTIALDDFGTGYSSLTYFSTFPLDKVKVDQAFIRGIDNQPVNAKILEAVVLLAQGLGLKVICEGVENAKERDIVRDLGGHQIQGYFFGKPLSATEISAWFARAQKTAA